MLRIRFTAEDLLRTRFLPAPAPLVELSLAAGALCGNGRGLLGPWVARTRRALPREALPLLELVSDAGAVEYLWALDHDFDTAVDRVLASPPAYVRESLAAVGRPGSAWTRGLASGDRSAQAVLERALRSARPVLDHQRVRAAWHTDVAHRREVLMTAGLGAALESVFPAARWHGDVLEVPHARELAIDLGGEGVVLLPTAFRLGSTLLGSAMPGQPRVVVYPARVPMPLIEASERTPALTPLLGRTRTAVLRTITRNPSSTTSQIAAALGISPGRASEHAGVLRDAGLITSHRHRNTVRHVPTPLGLEIG
ncbi:winged helix-turn-helix transcriptional regulator [Lentzea chajnantorensis]